MHDSGKCPKMSDVSLSNESELNGEKSVSVSINLHRIGDFSQDNQELCMPKVNLGERITDLYRLAVTRVKVDLGGTKQHRTPRSARPLSERGLFAYRYVNPLFNWWGKNVRVLSSASLGVVDVYDSSGGSTTLINGASHNYAGFYQSTPENTSIHQLTLRTLPMMCSEGKSADLRDEMQRKVAEFFSADFCVSTSTGYGSNYVALPALMSCGGKIGVFTDSHCHNSIFTGCFLTPSATMVKFRHNDMLHLADLLREKSWAFDEVFVVVEGLYSMEGDTPPLNALYHLKKQYDFNLFCDEAHSLCTLGRSGRGCLELWNERHPQHQVPIDMIDIRTATLSKSIGAIGGIIVGKAKFRDRVSRYCQRLSADDTSISLLTATAVQTLWVLGQPMRMESNLGYLREVAVFCRSRLAQAGVYVYGDADTPILPVWAGGPARAARMSYELRRTGLLATPVSTPAVPFWESRVRVNLSADYRPCDVDRLIGAIVVAAQKVLKGISVTSSSPVDQFHPTKQNSSRNGPTEMVAMDLSLIQHVTEIVDMNTRVLTVAAASQSRFGVGSGSARWISGTFPAHLQVECLVARLTGSQAALTYPDSSLGLASTVAALMRPIRSFKRHIVLAPWKMDASLRNGLILTRVMTDKINQTCMYRDTDDIWKLFAKKAAESVKTCFTLFVSVHTDNSAPSPLGCNEQPTLSIKALLLLLTRLRETSNKLLRSITVLVRLPSRPFDLRLLQSTHRSVGGEGQMHILLYGSFLGLYGLPGGFLAGPGPVIDELRYTSRGYMYTTSAPPFVMEMIAANLEGDNHE